MADEVDLAHPPKGVLKIINPVLRFLLRSPVGPRLDGQALINFTGRRTGRPYTVVVGWHELDGKGVFLTPARWRRNFSGGAPVTVHHRGVAVPGQGVLDADPDQVADAVNRWLSTGTSARELGLKVPPGRRVTPSEVSALHVALVRFTPAT